ncbi:MAG: hypothetical protein HYY18_21785 [Planctomycetes bacterium]|nr:hypothetical protein [Planctomycetota bacterium]
MTGDEIFKTVFLFFFCGGGVVFVVIAVVAVRAHLKKMMEAARLAQQAEAEEAPKRKKMKGRRAPVVEEAPPAILPVGGRNFDLAGGGGVSPGPALESLSGAQRIFVMAEIVGPPLALRGPGESLGPPGI